MKLASLYRSLSLPSPSGNWTSTRSRCWPCSSAPSSNARNTATTPTNNSSRFRMVSLLCKKTERPSASMVRILAQRRPTRSRGSSWRDGGVRSAAPEGRGRADRCHAGRGPVGGVCGPERPCLDDGGSAASRRGGSTAGVPDDQVLELEAGQGRHPHALRPVLHVIPRRSGPQLGAARSPPQSRPAWLSCVIRSPPTEAAAGPGTLGGADGAYAMDATSLRCQAIWTRSSLGAGRARVRARPAAR